MTSKTAGSNELMAAVTCIVLSYTVFGIGRFHYNDNKQTMMTA